MNILQNVNTYVYFMLCHVTHTSDIYRCISFALHLGVKDISHIEYQTLNFDGGNLMYM